MSTIGKNEEAVSPVIGVILMVAITVILAAVIAAFVFGMAGNIQKTKVVAATAQKTNSSSSIAITYQGGQDAPMTQDLNVTINEIYSGMIGTGTAPMSVGCTTIFNAGSKGGYSGRTHVVIIGEFSDGTQQIILDTYL